MLKHSLAEENYIKSIYHLQQEKKMVTTTELASHLKTKPASITDMLKKLKRKKIINYKAYYGCTLTNEGHRIALKIIRRHRLWEYFLSAKLGFNWDEVHEVAEELEHIQNDKLIERLDTYLSYPSFDPHGDPIPDVNGNITSNDGLALSEFATETMAIVTRINNQSVGLLDILQQKNIQLGSVLTVKQKHPFDQSLDIESPENKKLNISNELAKHILVKTYE